ncbi:MAG: class II aldolase/adducin family protein [Pseudomonadota bacterium]
MVNQTVTKPIPPASLAQEQRAEDVVRQELANAYQILARLGYDDLTYTHLSARVPGSQSFFMHPLGLLFEEVEPDNLLQMNLTGEVLHGTQAQYNQTGYIMHSALYQNRLDINAIFHLHTTAGVSVSAMQCGLLPLSQFALHFFNRMSYSDYDALVLDPKRHGEKLVRDLGQNKAMLLRNHGTLTLGSTIQEAFFYTNFLEKACQVQCQVLGSGESYMVPADDVCEQARGDMQNFETDLGVRDWAALVRKFGLESKG